MSAMVQRLALLSLAALVAPAGASNAQAAANPIRKVVTLLQNMQKKVTEEGEKAEELFDKFQCYCKNSGGDLSASIESAEAKLGELGPAIEASNEKKAKTEEELKEAQEDRAAAKQAMAEAVALRTKEKAAFDEYMGESKTNLVAMEKAIAALERGMAGGFLQTTAASTLRKVVAAAKDLDESDRQTLASFLSASTNAQYAPQSGEITGILKELKDEMFRDQSSTIATEEAAVKSHEELTAAKKKEVSALSKGIESKLERISTLGVEIATMKGDLGDTADSLEDDKQFLADLDKNCASKADTHAAEKKLRAEELVALADTIKVLNDDEALDLFKKALPGPSVSLVQVRSSTVVQRKEAMAAIAAARDLADRTEAGRHRVDIVMLALNGKKVGFEKVIKMIDELVVTLKQEQVDDDHKQEFCGVQFDTSDDKRKSLEQTLSDTQTLMASLEETISTTKEEIAALKSGITALDKSVTEATEQRKAENAEYKDLMANDSAAKELLLFAKNRLNKFYNPKLYKAAPKQELSEEDKIFVANGGTPPPTEAPGGIAGTGISAPALLQLRKQVEAPAPPPATAEAYKKKGEETNGVMAMMDLLIKDLTTEMTTSEAEEKAAQENYEKMMADSASKRAADAKSLSDKESAKADMEANLGEAKDSETSTSKELMAVEAYIASLHAECDWLLKYFDVRKQARAEEVDSLERAKAVLSGADYSLLQRSQAARTRKFLRH